MRVDQSSVRGASAISGDASSIPVRTVPLLDALAALGATAMHPNPVAAYKRITVTRLPAGLVSSLDVSRSSTGGSPGRRSKITSHPLSSSSPAR